MATIVSEPRAALAISSVVGGRYRVAAHLGQGGMGRVYRAVDLRDGREVALKQLRARGPATWGPAAALFQREYQTLCSLSHPSIIAVYDYGIDRDVAYYTMELLDGQDLRDRGRLPYREACELLRDVASALAVLHSRSLLHRDLSPRNVRCTRSGAAKLFDLGAMAPIGAVQAEVVGTPPFVPPEAVQLQALDARSDLYSLGALAYWLLTGRYAYCAREFRELPELWEQAPPSPRRIEPGVPAALDRLVMELLALDRSTRPATAAEVMERLCGIAGIEQAELPAVSRSYLNAPRLVGRTAALRGARTRLARGARGRGSSLLIQGEPGAGRSRLLQASMLEAKLLGATVLRADAADAERGPFGTARALAERLLTELPERARRRARPFLSVLGSLLPQLQAEAAADEAAAPRPQLQSALRRWITSVARSSHLVIAIDDVDAADVQSVALLAALSTNAPTCKLNLLMTAHSGPSSAPGLLLLRELGHTLELGPLARTEIAQLLRSTFGEEGDDAGLVRRIERLAGGNPQRIMALCERLVETGAARYEAGRWTLSAQLSARDLPRSLSELFRARLLGLSPEARALAEALALSDAPRIPVEDYPALSASGDPALTYRALGELLAAGVLSAEGERHRFAQDALPLQLEAALSDEQKRTLHARIAQLARDWQDPLLLPRHLLLAGREREGIESLLGLRQGPLERDARALFELLGLAVAAAERIGSGRRVQLELQSWLLACAARIGDYAAFYRYAGPLLHALEQDSGLHDLRPQSGEPETGLLHAQARWQATPEAERGFDPRTSMLRLGELCSALAAMWALAQEHAAYERLPDLSMPCALLPGLRAAQHHIEAMGHLLTGRYVSAQQSITRMFGVLDDAAASSCLRRDHVRSMRFDGTHIRALMLAVGGQEEAGKYLAELEREPEYRARACRLRMVQELAFGRTAAAAEFRRRSELYALQDGVHLPGTTAAMEFDMALLCEDLIGVKRALERCEALVATYPGWRCSLGLARNYYRRFRGDLEGALGELLPVLREVQPGRHAVWTGATTAHVGLLTALGRPGEAAERGLEYLEQAAAAQLPEARPALLRQTGSALALCGRFEQAVAFEEEYLRGLHAAGVRGVVLFTAYETRAKVAIAMRDEQALQHYAQLFLREYGGEGERVLSAKYQRLMREALAAGMPTALLFAPELEPGLHDAGELGARELSVAGALTARSRLLACLGTTERSHECLRLLLEMTGAAGGYLFVARASGLALLAASDDAEPVDGMAEWLGRELQHELSGDAETADGSGAHAQREGSQWRDASGRVFEALPLWVMRDDRRTPAGAAALHHDSDVRMPRRPEVLVTVARSMLDADADDASSLDPWR